jgi:broad specificity phosphatase PhoE
VYGSQSQYRTILNGGPLNCTLYLVRHGEVFNPNHVVYGDLPGFHLSTVGVQQVHRTGVHLARASLDLILSSPLARARETAAAIAGHHALDVLIDDRLTESRQFSDWTSHRWDSIADLFPGELENYLEDASSTGSEEQLADVAERYESAVYEAVSRGHSGIVIVGHQDPVQATRLSLTGRPLRELRLDPPGHGEVFSLARSDGGDWIEASRWSPVAHA